MNPSLQFLDEYILYIYIRDTNKTKFKITETPSFIVLLIFSFFDNVKSKMFASSPTKCCGWTPSQWGESRISTSVWWRPVGWLFRKWSSCFWVCAVASQCRIRQQQQSGFQCLLSDGSRSIARDIGNNRNEIYIKSHSVASSTNTPQTTNVQWQGRTKRHRMADEIRLDCSSGRMDSTAQVQVQVQVQNSSDISQ